jgi:DNA-binding transcriptional regulator YdaS (Cro superfamily)
MLRAQKTFPLIKGRPVGRQTALARVLGVKPQAVQRWSRLGYTPPDRALKIEELYGIPRRELIDPALIELIGSAPVEE